jgi:hypothetical protein
MEEDANNVGGGRPAGDGQPDAEIKIRAERIAFPKPFAKKLLDNYGQVWLFQVTEGRRTYYTVESQDRCWKFGFLFSAEGKFSREVKRQEGAV